MTTKELEKILLEDKPSIQIKQREQELFELLPELKRCKGFNQQNEWHIYDVYEHILHVIDGVPSEISLRLAALFHDLGKPSTFTTDEKGIGHFYGHWQESLNIFNWYIQNNELDPELIKKVQIYIYYHDISLDKVNDETLRKIGKENIGPLYTLKRADLLAQNPKFHYLLEDYGEQEQRALARIDRITHDRLNEILLEDNIRESIYKNLDYLLSIIPELKPMIGFPHNHPHHNLDVWEHTLEALSHSNKDFNIRLALLLHDIGKPHSYQDEEVRHFHGHADVSTQMSKDILTRLGYPKEVVDKVLYLIKYHDVAITPEEIETGDIEVLLERLHVQECDSKAHHPAYQQKRLDYIEATKKTLKK